MPWIRRLVPRSALSPNPAAGVPLLAALTLTTILQNLTCSAQNCDSLNVSTSCPKQLQKIKCITDLGTDIIFLSDLRLNNKDTLTDIKKIFLCSNTNQYMFYHNSTLNCRGVGILISCKLNCEILNIFCDVSENILVLNVSLSGHNFLLASIYGPNIAGNNFFQDLSTLLNSYPDSYKILAGDWNMTFSTANTNDNIDIYRMAAPPSLLRSRALADVCNTHHLSDPFRALHPDMRDFSYRPTNQRANRSRLDFFLSFPII